MEIFYSKSAVKLIKKLDKNMKQRMKSALEGLIESPPRGDIKQLQGVNPDVLFIKDIGSRGDIYK